MQKKGTLLLWMTVMATVVIFFLQNFYIQRDSELSKLLSIAEKQRTLSQKIALDTKLFLENETPFYEQQLLKSVLEFKTNNDILDKNQIRTMYAYGNTEHKKLIDAYILNALTFAKNRSNVAYRYIMDGHQGVLSTLDECIGMHINHYEESRNNFIVFSSFAAALLIVAMVVLYFKTIRQTEQSIYFFRTGSSYAHGTLSV